jgi:hypothetical protein
VSRHSISLSRLPKHVHRNANRHRRNDSYNKALTHKLFPAVNFNLSCLLVYRGERVISRDSIYGSGRNPDHVLVSLLAKIQLVAREIIAFAGKPGSRKLGSRAARYASSPGGGLECQHIRPDPNHRHNQQTYGNAVSHYPDRIRATPVVQRARNRLGPPKLSARAGSARHHPPVQAATFDKAAYRP